MEQTFGSFLREKRIARGLTLRGMAAKLDLSPVYMSNIENDRRAAPSQEYLERMALLLQLDKPEREWMLDVYKRQLPHYPRNSQHYSRTVCGAYFSLASPLA